MVTWSKKTAALLGLTAALAVSSGPVLPSGQAYAAESGEVQRAGALAPVQGLAVGAVTDTSVTLSWTAVPGADAYEVYRSDFGSGHFVNVGRTAGETSYKDEGLANNASYLYKVKALQGKRPAAESKAVLALTKQQVELAKEIDLSAAGAGARMRLGDLNGDGRLDILMVQPDYTGGAWRDAYVPHGVQALTAYDLDGNLLWQTGTPDPNVTGSGSDEPAQIYDIDHDGYNDVLYVRTVTQYDGPPENKVIKSKTDKFVILDGRTGQVKREHDLPVSRPTGDPRVDIDPVRSHDAILIADFAGDGKPSEIILKDRYQSLWVFDEQFNLLWEYNSADHPEHGAAAGTGHFPWPYDFDGDGKDELIMNYTYFESDGSIQWTAQGVADHVDTIQIGDVDGDRSNGREILLGGSDTLLYDRFGRQLWINKDTVEPQNVYLGDFRIDIPGYEIYGLDRVNRSAPGQDSLFIFSRTGETLFQETPDDSGFGTVPKIVNNWNGTHAPLMLAYRRGTLNGEVIKPKLYDGFFNPVAEFEFDANFTIADIGGDSREEIIAYTATKATIYSGGPVDLTSDITGKPRAQFKEHYNFSRYNANEAPEITSRTPAGLKAQGDKHAVELSWIPVLDAIEYTVYRADRPDGAFEKIGTTRTASFTDKKAKKGQTYVYKVSASGRDGSSQPSDPVQGGVTR
ncbi:hypothetical protein J2T17_007284 [Paenibacillus mucilaginosus]|uniref:fibronectin type III domain-containing protein n=1 Tax=Paenibacillus mucilaginosus TaxID=61624 RepID=UPI003D24005E